ncbi:MAG: hypothetical protein QM704_04635 [Anaeromyxobacteraceae bacterium]
MARPKTRDERLFSAAVLRRSFELQEKQYEAGFKFVYDGVLRDLELTDAEVAAFLAAHREEVERAIGRKGTQPAPRRPGTAPSGEARGGAGGDDAAGSVDAASDDDDEA